MKTSKVVRGIVGVVVLLLLFGLVMNWVGDYRSASRKPAGSGKSTTSAENTSTAPSDGGETVDTTPDDQGSTTPTETAQLPQLVVLVDGLNFRSAPQSDAKARRGLKKGERVDLLEDLGAWYKVRDADGVIGYITSNASYTRSAD